MRILCAVLALSVAIPALPSDWLALRMEAEAIEGNRPRKEKKAPAGFWFRKEIKKLLKEKENDLLALAKFLYGVSDRYDVQASLNRVFRRELPILHWALHRSDVDVDKIEILLIFGADPNIILDHDFQDRNAPLFFKGYRPAHSAVRMHKSIRYLAVLQKYGANFLVEDEAGWTPLHIAKAKRYYSGMKYLEWVVAKQSKGMAARSN